LVSLGDLTFFASWRQFTLLHCWSIEVHSIFILLAVPDFLPALPFCHVTLKAPRPSTNYPKKLETLGDHIKSRRLTLKLFQRQVADELGTDETTVFHWERNMV